MRVWSIGEVLWDVFPDPEFGSTERFGGAPLNFCANLTRLGDEAMLLSAVGRDKRGYEALERMQKLGLTTRGVTQVDEAATGAAIISTLPDGETAFRIERPAAFDMVSVPPETFAEAKTGGVDWLYFGTLLQTEPRVEALTVQLRETLQPARVFYDMNLRTGHWNLALVQRLSHLASVLKLNETEAATLFHLTQTPGADFALEDFCREWASTYGIDVVCVTLGAAGCLVYVAAEDEGKGKFYQAPGYEIKVRDTVGAGDAFAAAFLHGYDRGWPVSRTARFANALGAVVASRAGATPDWTTGEVLALARLDDPTSPS